MNKPAIYTTKYDHDRKALTLEQLVDFNVGGHGADWWYERPRELTAEAAYREVGWYKRCVDVRARSLASMPWALYGPRSDDPIVTETDDLPDDLAWFNPGRAFFRFEVALTVTGSAYALIEKSGRRVTNLFHFNPFTIKPKYTKQGIAYYERWVDGVHVANVTLDDMLAIFSPDPFVEQGPGASDGNAARVHAQVLQDLAGYTSENLRSGLVKKIVWTAEGRPPEKDERERVEDWLTRFIMGRNRTRTKVLSGQLTPQEIGSDLSDLGDKEITEDHQRAIATALGVPHSLVMSDAANYATAAADQLNFITTTLAHECRIVEEALNNQIFGPAGMNFRFEIERTEAVQRSESEKALSVVALFTGGVLTRDEVRQTLGYDPLGEEEEQQAGMTQDEDEDEDRRSVDIDRWRKKVENRGDREVKFSPDHLTGDEAAVIRERLASGAPLDEVFSPPFSSF